MALPGLLTAHCSRGKGGCVGGVRALPEEAGLCSDGFLLHLLSLYQLFTEAPSASVDRNRKQIND